MGNTTTLKDQRGADIKPRKETISFLLSYSKALEIVKLNNSEDVSLIRN